MPTKKDSAHYSGLEQPWTTARCHRLIRPLVSGIQALKNETVNERAATSSYTRQRSQVERVERDPEWNNIVPRRRLKRTYSDRSASGLSRNTLSKGGKQETKECRPGEILVPTPFLRRTRCDVLAVAGSETCEASPQNSHQPSDAAGTFVSRPMGASVERVQEAFERILAATTTEPPPPTQTISSSGAKSLFILCLQTVPVLMAEEQRQRKEIDPDDDNDVSAEIYAELEGLEPLPGSGWKNLAEVVRAHAVLLLRTAILELLLDRKQTRRLLTLCHKYNAKGEADRLFASFTVVQTSVSGVYGINIQPSTTQGYSTATTFNASLETLQTGEHMFNKLCKDWSPSDPKYFTSLFKETPMSHGAKIGHIANLIQSERMPLEVLADASWRTFWGSIVQSISRGDVSSARSAQFMFRILAHACGVSKTSPVDALTERKCNSQPIQEQAIQNTVVSLLGLLISTAIGFHSVSEDEACAVSMHRVMWPLHALSYAILREIVRQDDLNRHTSCGHQDLHLVVFAAEVVVAARGLHKLTDTPYNPLGLRLQQLSIIHDRYTHTRKNNSAASQMISKLLATIAHCSAKVLERPAFEVLRDTLESMLSFQVERRDQCLTESLMDDASLQRATLLVRTWVLSSAMEFAQQSQDPAHQAYAENLERSAGQAITFGSGRPSTGPGLQSPPVQQRFRWEEGLCEWVTATPARAGVRIVSEAYRPPYTKKRLTVHAMADLQGDIKSSDLRASEHTSIRIPAVDANTSTTYQEPPAISGLQETWPTKDKENVPPVTDSASCLIKARNLSEMPSVSAPRSDIIPGTYSSFVQEEESDEDELSKQEPHSALTVSQQTQPSRTVPMVLIAASGAQERSSIISQARETIWRSKRATRSAVAQGLAIV